MEFFDRMDFAIDVLSLEKSPRRFLNHVEQSIELFYNNRRICKSWIESCEIEPHLRRYLGDSQYGGIAANLLKKLNYIKSPDYVSYFDIRLKFQGEITIADMLRFEAEAIKRTKEMPETLQIRKSVGVLVERSQGEQVEQTSQLTTAKCRKRKATQEGNASTKQSVGKENINSDSSSISTTSTTNKKSKKSAVPRPSLMHKAFKMANHRTHLFARAK